ncbi:MAG: orotidine-5'-phosphate decarboxylase [Halobacteriales archaeon]|nr:orotidine-5'-phosphate decarboxylase [Halobacteriales archaeon]
MSFPERVREAVRAARGPVCVGLDPDPGRLPPTEDPLVASLALCHRAVRATRGLAAAYKPNSAFFEAHGGPGFDGLSHVRADIRAPAVSILDAKRGDIGSTARMYAKWAFGRLDYDAITLHPLLGWDSIEPFLEWPDKGVFLLVRTSNPGAKDFQDLEVNGQPLYLAIAERVAAWAEEHDGIGAVCGATWPEELAKVRRALGDDVPILVPGVGAQGGSAREVVRAAGSGPLLINSSRGILYAGDGGEGAMREAAEKLRSECQD